MNHKCKIKIKYDPEIKAIQYYIFCLVCNPYNPEEEPVELLQTPFFDYALYYAISHYLKYCETQYQ